MIILDTIEFVEIHDYIEPFGVKMLELVFLSLYALLLFIQFVAMIIHRIITMVHYIGTLSKRTEQNRVDKNMFNCHNCLDTVELFIN